MEFTTLLKIGRDLKAENCNIIRDCLEKAIELDNEQLEIIYTLNENGLDIETAIYGVYNSRYCVHSNFSEYIYNLLSDMCSDLPSFIELDYISMWYRTFRYDDNLYIDWQELGYHKDRDEYGTSEQKQKYRDYIEYNLQYSQIIEFYY